MRLTALEIHSRRRIS